MEFLKRKIVLQKHDSSLYWLIIELKKKLASILSATNLTIPTNMIRTMFLIFLDISPCQILYHKVCITSNQSVIMLVDKSSPRPFAGNVTQHKDVNAIMKRQSQTNGSRLAEVSCLNKHDNLLRECARSRNASIKLSQLSHLHSFVRNNCHNLETWRRTRNVSS